MYFWRKIFLILGSFGITIFPLFGFAVKNPITAESFEAVATAIADFLINKLLAPISVIIVLYAAFLYMTAGGSEEKVKKAHKALFWALVGIGVVLIGSGVVNIIKDVLGVK